MTVAALKTGMRKGELLSLQWSQIRFSPRAEVFLPAGKTKAKKARRGHGPLMTVAQEVAGSIPIAHPNPTRRWHTLTV